MSISPFFRNPARPHRAFPAPPAKARSRKPFVEVLEDRTLLASNYLVDLPGDAGTSSGPLEPKSASLRFSSSYSPGV